MNVEEVFMESAKSAFDFLSPAHGHFSAGVSSRRWLFRGLPNSDFQLLPTALREGSIEGLNALSGRVNLPGHITTATQVYYEFNVLAKFYAEVDAQGLPVADDAPELRPYLHRPGTWALTYLKGLLENGDTWPPKPLRGLAALAQHHGLPTRLLDWSLDPYVACYFACQSHGSRGEHIAIWAMDSFAIERSGGAVELVTAPAASNPNLHAQKGVFTVNPIVLNDVTAFSELECTPTDQLLTHVKTLGEPIIYKIHIPRSEVEELGMMVSRAGYNPNMLFPGYEGAAKSVFDQCRQLTWPKGKWGMRVTLIVPESKQQIANTAASLLDPDVGGHKTFANACYDNSGARYFLASGGCLDGAVSFIRQVIGSLEGVIFFIQRSSSYEILDTNSAVALGEELRPADLITAAGFSREEPDL